METRGSGSKLIFSVDLEDWYHGIEIPHSEWTRFEDRVHVGMEELLQLLKLHETKATFFVLGSVAEKHPSLIERIVDQGHEVGTHGYYHQKVYELTEVEFDDEIKRAVKALRAITGSQVRGHRAPYFSITSRSTWAFKVLRDNGIQYDASVYPGHNWRYGIPNTPDTSYLVQPYDLIEFPVSTFRLLGKTLGIGGAYFRIVPYHAFKTGIRERLRSNKPTCFYIHPWELDPRHPFTFFRPKAMITHYAGLGFTHCRLRKLLKDFRFTSFERYLGQVPRSSLEAVEIEHIG